LARHVSSIVETAILREGRDVGNTQDRPNLSLFNTLERLSSRATAALVAPHGTGGNPVTSYVLYDKIPCATMSHAG
jgi:hypothetical protein